MLVAVQSQDRLNTVALPPTARGAHWASDASGARLASIEGRDGAWLLEPVGNYVIRGADRSSNEPIVLDPCSLAIVNIDDPDGASWCLVFYPDDESSLVSTVYGFSGDAELTVGRSKDNVIVYSSSLVSSHHMKLAYREGKWQVVDLDSSNGVFVNGTRIRPGSVFEASFGDVVIALGLRITLGSGFFACNNPSGAVTIPSERFVRYRCAPSHGAERRAEPERPYFYPALRFARTVDKKSFTIDAPPQREKEDKTSLIMKIGPSFVMGLASVMSAAVFISMMAEQGISMLRAVPMVGMAVAMLAGSVLWPILNTRHERKEREQNEAMRRGAYSQYLSGVLSEISKEEELQKAILSENRIPIETCLELARQGDVHLMDRAPLHADYLDIRIGCGDEPFEADVRFPDRRFSLEDDELRDMVDAQASKPHVLHDVPLAFPLIEKHVVGIIGDPRYTRDYARGVIVQIAALCSYENVKIAVLCDEDDRENWVFASHLPHSFADDRRMRYFACGLEETTEVGMFIERVLDERRAQDRFDAREAAPYYVVVCASERLIDKANVVRAIVEEHENKGISLVAIAREMRDLPKECRSVIGVDEGSGYLLDRDDPSGRRKEFNPDIFVSRAVGEDFAFSLSRVRLDIKAEGQQIPSRLGFLEMLGVGSVEHVNIASRWAESNASATLACPVGVDAQGEPFLLNLHEKDHGPHGLIAGTTGSGKSEFIITYIMSMAMTYSPDDIAFVLIDYKGGGLARAFDNGHVRLPHLAGVITNLDGAAISRSLASIQSELKRRQALFNRARDVVGGDNVDIYDYLDLFRQGRMTEPCPHLFIVADEFAELKQQEPEFMDELISAARIGRSLGVHLILATQKPTGVVNDQIWSNSRFKVCLKVADAADSNEMIKRPDAAELQQAGRFYLLVGYNEFFALGQSGYAGTPYVPKEKFTPTVDESVVMISDTGRPLVSVKPHQEGVAGGKRPESVVVLSAIEDAAAAAELRARQLWLEPIPAVIVMDALAEKYGRAFGEAARSFGLNPLIGEFDDPTHQRQGALTLPLSMEGNALLYGTSDSGVELALNAMMYSLVRDHDAQSLNVYILDFGSESLRAFASAPQVGDVAGLADEEKVRRFFDFIDGEFAERRALMSSYGGSFARYAQEHDDKPAIVVVFNDIAAFLEAYERLEDDLAKLTREAGRNGIFLVATAPGSSSVRVRMRQGFRQILACNLADTTDYGMIFGSMRGVPEPKGFGRGLVALEDGVFEFQAAHLTADGDGFGFAEACSTSAAESARIMGQAFAPEIPVAPDIITPSVLGSYESNANFVPYGVYDADLSVAGFDFSDSSLARCQFQRRKDGAAFMRAFLESMRSRDAWEVAVLDLDELLGSSKPEGCVFATRKAELAKAYLEQNVFGRKKRRKGDPKLLLVFSGIVDFINGSGVDFSPTMKDFLRNPPEEAGVRILLADTSSATSYTYEDWFKAHLTSKDGLWIGPGIEGQSVINITYSNRLAPDSEMKASKGYAVDGGTVQLVHLVSILEDEGGEAETKEVEA